ncbi:MAG: TadE/TadG family type IV pilus assembly protein [Pseudomonadota bacterium]
MVIASRFRRFIKSVDGVAALEFAICLPLFVLLYLSSFSMVDYIRSIRQVTNSMNTIAELSSRRIDLNDDERDALFATAEALLGTSSGGIDMDISITSVINGADEAGDIDYEVSWSEGTSSAVTLSTGDLPSFVLPELTRNESLILVVARAEITPSIVAFDLPSSIEIDRYAVRKPRFVSEVIYIE